MEPWGVGQSALQENAMRGRRHHLSEKQTDIPSQLEGDRDRTRLTERAMACYRQLRLNFRIARNTEATEPLTALPSRVDGGSHPRAWSIVCSNGGEFI